MKNKPMPPQFIELNGRTIPVFPPYHEKDGDWVVTGDRNPLPVAGYGMTESGVWIPRKVSDEGHDLTQLTGSNGEEELLLIDRGIRAESRTIKEINTPIGAKGCIFTLIIYGITGTFNSN